MRLIDIHTHNGQWEHTSPQRYDYLGETMPDFIADLDADRVDYCFMSSVEALLGDIISGNKKTFDDAMLDDRLGAYVYYDPTRIDDSVREIEKYKDHPKFVGFKSRPEYHSKMRFDSDAYRPLIEASESLDKPILLHTWPIHDAECVANVASKSKAIIILVHAFGESFRTGVPLIRHYETVYIEPVTSTVFPGKLRFIINEVGVDRVMFGSDYGLMSREKIINQYRDADLSSHEKDAFFFRNAQHVFKI